MIKYKIIKNKNIKYNQIINISKLKDTFWRYGIKSQKKFLKSNFKSNDLHILAYKNNNIIGYVSLRMSSFTKNNNYKNYKYFLFDGFIVNKLFRNLNIGKNIIKICRKKSKFFKMPILLLCKKSVLQYYTKLNFKVISKKNYLLINYQYAGYLLRYNLNYKNTDLLKIKFEKY